MIFNLSVQSARLPWTRLRDIGYLVASNLFKLALAFATSIVVVRLLGADQLGRLTLALGIVGLFSIVGEFGLRDAAVNYIARFLQTAPEQAYAVARSFLIARVLLALVASAVGVLGAGFVASQFYPNARVADLIQLGAFSLFTSGLLAFAIVVLEAQQNFAQMGLLGIVQAVVRAGLVGVLLVSHSVNLYSLLVLESLVPLAVFIHSLRILPRPFYTLRRPFLAHIGALFHFTKWIAVAALASALLTRLDVLVLSYYRPPAQVGYYAVALAIVSRMDVLKNAVLTTAFPEACRSTSPSDLRAFVLQSLRLTGLAAGALLPVLIVGGYLIEWLYGVEYRSAVPAFYLLMLGFLISLNAQPVAFVLYPLNRPRWIAAIDLLQLVCSIAFNLILIPILGLVGAALGVLLTRILHALITVVLVRHLLWRRTDM